MRATRALEMLALLGVWFSTSACSKILGLDGLQYDLAGLKCDPANLNFIADRGEHSAPATPPPLPAVGASLVDPIFGSHILRVTGPDDGEGCFSANGRFQAFNADSTRLFVTCNYEARLFALDAASFTVTSKGALFLGAPPSGNDLEDIGWSATDTNMVYGHDVSHVYSYGIDTGQYTLVKDFGAIAAGMPGAVDEKTQALGEMTRSLDDNVFAFSRTDPGANSSGYLVWRRDTDEVLIDVTNDVPWHAVIDKRGEQLFVWYHDKNPKVIDLATGAATPIVAVGEGFAVGEGLVVGNSGSSNAVVAADLGSAEVTMIVNLGDDFSQSGDFSMLAASSAWALGGMQANSDPAPGLFHDEIFLAGTDGSRIARLAHHWFDGGGARLDSSEINPTISADGCFVAFTSTWGLEDKNPSGNMSEREDVFLVNVGAGR